MKQIITGLFFIIIITTAILACGCLTQTSSTENSVQPGGDIPSGTATQTLPPVDQTISQNLDEYMTSLTDAGRFSGAVLVAKDGNENETGQGNDDGMILLTKGYGLANYEFSVGNTPQTVFPIGSNTKQFTAAGIMKLQEQGRLNVTDPVSWYIADAPQWKDIRIYHLLNHTSGIPSEGGFLLTDPFDFPLPELVNRFTDLPLTFEPGEGYTYSNNGYITLAYIIEQASGQTYDEYLRENLFEPLGMNSTGQDNARDVFTGRASGYTTMDARPVHYDLQNIHNSYGAGSLHSTTEDLYRWERAFHTPGAILTSASMEEMAKNNYGIVSGRMFNRTVSGHGGRNFGFISYTLHFPEDGVSIMYLSNYDRTPMANLTRDLSAIVFGEPYSLPEKIERQTVALNEQELEEYAGVYELEWEKTWTFTVTPDANRLFYTSIVPHETVELFYEGNDTFFVTPESADSFIFTRDDTGTIDGMVMYTMEGSYDKMVKAE